MKRSFATTALTLMLVALVTLVALGPVLGHTGGQVWHPMETNPYVAKVHDLYLDGTQVTSTAAELNALDGLTSTVAELNILDGVTSTAAELNFVDVTAGTNTASKAMVLDANQAIDAVNTATLSIGASGAEVALTATPTELNTTVDGATTTAAELNAIHNDAGGMASAVVDFNAVGTATMTVTINSVAYLEADTADAPNGVWTNGASANDSATSLIAAINGDTRAAVPFTAVAGIDTDAIYFFWDAVGTAGNITISSDDGAATTENSLGGAAVADQPQMVTVEHTVTTQGLLSGGVEIPLPFVPVGFIVQARNSSGLLHLALTDLVTIQTTPDRLRIDTDGATNLANTDVVNLIAWQ